MTGNGKGRGRPPGSEIDDQAMLAKVADMIAANSAMKPTTAMRRIKPRATTAELRRWQTKWKERHAELMADAQRRADERKAAKAAINSQSGDPFGVAGLMQATRAMREFADSPALRAIRQMQDNPTFRLMREIQNSPAMRLAQAYRDSPAGQLGRLYKERAEALKLLRGTHFDRFEISPLTKDDRGMGQ